jgi:hypothetical protein
MVIEDLLKVPPTIWIVFGLLLLALEDVSPQAIKRVKTIAKIMTRATFFTVNNTPFFDRVAE